MGLIEICSGDDVVRGPMGAAIGNALLRKKGIGSLRFTSSGTRAAARYDDLQSYEEVVAVLAKVGRLQINGEYPFDEEKFSENINYQTDLREKAISALELMRALQITYRKLAVWDCGLIYPKGRTQTGTGTQPHLALGVDSESTRLAGEVYKGTAHVNNMQEYAEVTCELSDLFGSTNLSMYIHMRTVFESALPKVIERAMRDGIDRVVPLEAMRVV